MKKLQWLNSACSLFLIGMAAPASCSAQGLPPAITSVVNDATFQAGGPISPGSWVAIFGTNLAPAGDSRLWNTSTEILNGKLPTSLDGTSVTVNGKPAVVEFISPSQVNIQPPDDNAVGPVQVVVTTAAGASNSFTVNYAKFVPRLFRATSTYLVGQHADNSYVTTTAPAKPGEVIILWGTGGFGPANPAVPAGQVFTGANPLANIVTAMIGGQPAAVDFAGVVGAGLVQINVHVPSSINNGDAGVIVTVAGISAQTAGNSIPIQNSPTPPPIIPSYATLHATPTFEPSGHSSGPLELSVTPDYPGNATYSGGFDGGVSLMNGTTWNQGLTFTFNTISPGGNSFYFGTTADVVAGTAIWLDPVSSATLSFTLKPTGVFNGSLSGTLSVTGTPHGGGAAVTVSGPISGTYVITCAEGQCGHALGQPLL